MNIGELVPHISADKDKGVSYERYRSFVAKNFFGEDLLSFFKTIIPQTEYFPHEYEIGPESRVQEFVAKPRFMWMVRELMNKPSVISALQEITGIKGLHDFKGRHYKLDSSVEGIEWHHDLDSNKKLGVTINISPENFEGGELVIRHKPTGELQKFHNTGAGDAIFFEIHEDYEHCVLKVSGDVPKLAITGWYHV